MAWCNQCGQSIEEDQLVAGPPQRLAGAADQVGGAPALEPPDGAEPGGESRDRCPMCGSVVEPAEGTGDEEQTHVKAPWHFKVLLVGSVLYLAYRLYQGIGWLIHHV